MSEFVVVLDFGGQYSHLIARRVRECGVYCEVVPYTLSLDKLLTKKPKGIIFTGGPNSVYAKGSPRYSSDILHAGIPVLGLCYGAQLIAYLSGGEVKPAPISEYGRIQMEITAESALYAGVDKRFTCWMSHTDYISRAPEGFVVTAKTADCPCASMEDAANKIYAVQYHPEVEHTQFGSDILRNFLYNVCQCENTWKMDTYTRDTIASLKEKIGDKKALCALSGGVDSTVAAVMMQKAIGSNLVCIFVDHGLLRKNEGDEVERMCRDKFNMNFIRVDAKDRFLEKLKGILEPEQKRKIIGEEFIRVFEEEAKKIGKVNYLVQGTIYPDIIESGSGASAVIKSHHNVGGLPSVVDFDEIVEPLRLLFKDEVRKVGIELGIDEDIVWRQPFPGPGLAVRVIDDITEEKLDILRDADFIFREEIQKAGMARSVNQYFAVLTNVKSVGVMGDFRTYDYAIGLRAVTTSDFMTADFARIPYEVLEKVSARIVNEVKHVNRVLYDITPKPPSTIEWL